MNHIKTVADRLVDSLLEAKFPSIPNKPSSSSGSGPSLTHGTGSIPGKRITRGGGRHSSMPASPALGLAILRTGLYDIDPMLDAFGIVSSSYVNYDTQDKEWRGLAKFLGLSLSDLASELELYANNSYGFPGMEGLADLTNNHVLMKHHDWVSGAVTVLENATTIYSFIYGGRRYDLARQHGLMNSHRVAEELACHIETSGPGCGATYIGDNRVQIRADNNFDYNHLVDMLEELVKDSQGHFSYTIDGVRPAGMNFYPAGPTAILEVFLK